MSTRQAYICDAIRTPFGRYGGALSSVRADDLGAIPLKALMARHPGLDWAAVTDVIFGCANQAGEAWTPLAPRRAPSRPARPA
jgi:acetyl-CoA acyltransferase